MTGFDVVWQRIVTLEGEVFRQKTGRPFCYRISGNCVLPSTTNRLLPRSQFAHAFGRAPLAGPGQLQDLQGPSYLFAILTDPRVAAGGPGAAPAGPDVSLGHADRAADNWPAEVRVGGSGALPGIRAGPAGNRAPVPGVSWLSHVNPLWVLLVIPCSAAKARGGLPPASGRSEYGDWPTPMQEARAQVLAGVDADVSGLLPAWQRYEGAFYRSARPALAQAATTGNVVILSGGYGVARAQELIGWYDKALRRADWPPGLLESALIGQAQRAGVDTVVAFAAETTGYAHLLRRTPWRDAGLQGGLVTVKGATAGAMAEVPRRLGLAFAAFWNQRHDGYPPGTVVEQLS